MPDVRQIDPAEFLRYLHWRLMTDLPTREPLTFEQAIRRFGTSPVMLLPDGRLCSPSQVPDA